MQKLILKNHFGARFVLICHNFKLMQNFCKKCSYKYLFSIHVSPPLSKRLVKSYFEKKTKVPLLAPFFSLLPSTWVNRNFQVKSNVVGFEYSYFAIFNAKKSRNNKCTEQISKKRQKTILTHFQSFCPAVL